MGKFRYLYHPDEKYFIKAIELEDIDQIAENSTGIPPKIPNYSFNSSSPYLRYIMDKTANPYSGAEEITETPITSDTYLPNFLGSFPTYSDVFINNYWLGEDWEIRNTPLAFQVAQENEIVRNLMDNGFFLVEKQGKEQGREQNYYILLHKENGYETLVAENDKEWSKELYYAGVLSAIDFVSYEFEKTPNNQPPDANVYYYAFDQDGRLGEIINAPLEYGEQRRPNPDPSRMTEVMPDFNDKPPLNSTDFFWNKEKNVWEIKNTIEALSIARKYPIVWDMVQNKGFVLVDVKKSYYKGLRIGVWCILWNKENEYTIVHSLDKEWFKEKYVSYDHAVYEILLIENNITQANPDEPITKDEIEESIVRWNRYKENENSALDSQIQKENETLLEDIEREWNEKIESAKDWSGYYIENMKQLIDRNFEEDKIFYYLKARFIKNMEDVRNEKS